MTLLVGLLLGVAMIGVGVILLVFHKNVASFWRSIGMGARGGKVWYFSVYQLGPALLIAGGAILVVLALFGAFRAGPAPFKG